MCGADIDQHTFGWEVGFEGAPPAGAVTFLLVVGFDCHMACSLPHDVLMLSSPPEAGGYEPKGMTMRSDDELGLQDSWVVTKPEHGSAAWLKVRRSRNGEMLVAASDAAAVHGVHRFKSMAQLAVELLDPADPTPTVANAAMQRGNKLEPVLLRWAETELQTTIRTPDVMFGYGRLIATLDGMTPSGTVVECKTTTRRFGGSLPPYWRWQGVQQAICANSDKVLWVVLDGDLNLTLTEQHVDDDDIKQHLRAVDRFLAAIDMGMLPAEAVPTVEDIARLNREVSPVPADLPENALGLLDWYWTVDAQAKQAKDELEKCKAEIVALLGASEVGLLGGEEVVTWKMQSRRSFDSARFEAEHPELAAEFMKVSKFRTLRVKGGK